MFIFRHVKQNQDIRISQTPYHALTTQERLVYNERKELLAFIAKSFREEVSKYENFLRIPTPITGKVFLLSNFSSIRF